MAKNAGRTEGLMMRLPDRWYQKDKYNRARHKAAYNRNKLNKQLAKYSRLVLCAFAVVAGLVIIGVSL